MFSFFKRKNAQQQLMEDMAERLINEQLFLKGFDTLFKNFDTSKKTIVEKIWMFSASLAEIISDKAANNGKEICDYTSSEKTASMIVYVQSAEIISNSLQFTDKQALSNLYINGGARLIRKEQDIPTPTEQADISHMVLMRSMMIKNHFDIIQSINKNCLDYLYTQKDESLHNLATGWSKIEAILSQQCLE